MRIAVAGSGRLAAGMLAALLRSDHEVVAVVQNGRKTRGRLRRWVIPRYLAVMGGSVSVTGMAVRRGIPIVWIDRMQDDLKPLRALQPDILLVGGFDIIFKRSILDLPRIACINTHSSLLPKHRGPNPFCWPILMNDPETGITFHLMDEGIDTGDIVEQYAFPIEPADSALNVHNKACEVAASRIVEVMDAIARHGVKARPQDHALATYDPKVTAQDAWIDWTRTAEDIERQIRGLNPVMMARFRIKGREVRVLRAKADPAPVEAAPGTVLAARPFVCIATGQGTITIRIAYSTGLFPFIWPFLGNRPEAGDKVSAS